VLVDTSVWINHFRLPNVDLEQDEVLAFIERQHLSGSGLGWIDMHLLASARLARQSLWSADRRLRQTATQLGLTDDE
jgi:predicted nucleic acid-binding protein